MLQSSFASCRFTRYKAGSEEAALSANDEIETRLEKSMAGR